MVWSEEIAGFGQSSPLTYKNSRSIFQTANILLHLTNILLYRSNILRHRTH
jgi:hypothetical protein